MIVHPNMHNSLTRMVTCIIQNNPFDDQFVFTFRVHDYTLSESSGTKSQITATRPIRTCTGQDNNVKYLIVQLSFLNAYFSGTTWFIVDISFFFLVVIIEQHFFSFSENIIWPIYFLCFLEKVILIQTFGVSFNSLKWLFCTYNLSIYFSLEKQNKRKEKDFTLLALGIFISTRIKLCQLCTERH